MKNMIDASSRALRTSTATFLSVEDVEDDSIQFSYNGKSTATLFFILSLILTVVIPLFYTLSTSSDLVVKWTTIVLVGLLIIFICKTIRNIRRNIVLTLNTKNQIYSYRATSLFANQARKGKLDEVETLILHEEIWSSKPPRPPRYAVAIYFKKDVVPPYMLRFGSQSFCSDKIRTNNPSKEDYIRLVTNLGEKLGAPTTFMNTTFEESKLPEIDKL